MGEISSAIDAVFRNGSTVLSAGLTTACIGAGGVAITANAISSVFGPEDVLPITAVACGSVCIGTPLLLGGGYRLMRGSLSATSPYWWINQYHQLREAVYRPAVTPAPVVAPQPTQPADPPSAFQRDPLTPLLDALHLLVIGHTGGGKTTLMHSLATRQARHGHKVLVIDPDAAMGMWPDCHVVGYGGNFDQIKWAYSRVGRLFSDRLKLRAQGQRHFQPVYVVCDEYSAVVDEVTLAKQVTESVLRRGRKLDIHLYVGVQDSRVKTMNIEGQGALRENFTYIVEATLDRTKGQRWLTISQPNGDKTTVLTPRLPDPERYIVGRRLNTTRTTSTPRTTLVGGNGYHEYEAAHHLPHHPRTTSAPVRNSPAPVRNDRPHHPAPPAPVRQNGSAPPPHHLRTTSDPLGSLVNRVLVDESPSPIRPLTTGQVKAITLCLMADESLNRTCELVWGAKSSDRYEWVKTVRATLPVGAEA